VIDLSYGAAVKLGYMKRGTARVRVELLNIAGVDDRRDSTAGVYRYVQLGAFGSEEAARHLRGELAGLLGTPVFISSVQSGEGMLYRVRVGPLADQAQLLAVRQQLEASGHGSGQPLP
jgi:rare lipoprotein A